MYQRTFLTQDVNSTHRLERTGLIRSTLQLWNNENEVSSTNPKQQRRTLNCANPLEGGYGLGYGPQISWDPGRS